jgi:hypothetical protein
LKHLSATPEVIIMIAKNTIRYSRWIALLAVYTVFGCTSGPQQKGIWPWEYGKDFGRYKTGDHISVSGNVAQFGDAPKVAKPVTSETAESSAGTTGIKADRPDVLPDSKPGAGNTINDVRGEYDFQVKDVKIAPPSYLPVGSVRDAFDITAFNRGIAPVSVVIDLDPKLTKNVSTDKTLPLTAVIPPHSDQAVVHMTPKMKNETYTFRYSYSWSIGNYTVNHQCPEHYQFPFGNSIRAFATVSDAANSTPYTRYAVVFSMPAGTPVLASRRGVVIRATADGKIDILHDDLTIATYSHLEKTGEGVITGKAVAAGDILGIAGAAGKRHEANMQLAVWRPVPRPAAAVTEHSAGSGFDMVSFPLEFCRADLNKCSVLSKNQSVSRNRPTEKKKQKKRKFIPAK